MTPTQYVAFLRAINVGGHVVKMTDLKKIFEGLRLSDVATLIASGNVIFRSSAKDTGKLQKQIERGLQEALGYPVATFLRTTREVAAVAEHQPFDKRAVEGSTLYIGFLPAPPSHEAAKQVTGFRTETDEFHVAGRELYWLCRTNMSDSRFNYAVLEKAVKMSATFRNATTIRRLAAKYPPIVP